jgi:glycosyltransferase involved in cell wall biosynthesis
MRICIDIQSAVAQRAGVGRYTQKLVEHLGEFAASDEVSLFYFDFQRRGLSFPTPNSRQQAIRWCPGRYVQQAWKRLHWPPFEWFAGPADLYHFPNFTIPPVGRGRKVVTIHDMSFVRFPDFAEKKNLRYLSTVIRDTVARADAIITDSRFSADEIGTLLKVSPDRIFPIHLGVAADCVRPASERLASVRQRYGLSRPYLLTVGTLEPRKNLSFLVEVFEQLETFDGELVIAGMRGWKFEPILARMRSSPQAARIRYLEYVDDADLPALYAGAELLALTSHYEGFGLPVLEAMACGTPVVSSTGGSLPEIVGQAGITVPGFDPAAWATTMNRVLCDTSLRETLIQSGLRHAAGFTWRETARQTFDVYRKVSA